MRSLVGRRDYANRWRTNAEAYDAQGLYRKLAEHLSSFVRAAKVIDVGCGRGQGRAVLEARLRADRSPPHGRAEKKRPRRSGALKIVPTVR